MQATTMILQITGNYFFKCARPIRPGSSQNTYTTNTLALHQTGNRQNGQLTKTCHIV